MPSDAPDLAQQEAHVLQTVKAWLQKREVADAYGASLLSTSDIIVRTPLGTVNGIENVKTQIYKAASPAVLSQTGLEAKRTSPGVWSVKRNYSVSKAGSEFTLRQEWMVVQRANPKSGGGAYESLVAEVTSAIA